MLFRYENDYMLEICILIKLHKIFFGIQLKPHGA